MATLSSAMLSDLHSGSAAISLLTYSGGVTFASLDFSAADQLFTLKDSLTLSSDDPSTNDIRIDQFDQIIDTIFEDGGNWTVSGNVPSVATAVFDYFFNSGVASVTAVKGQTVGSSSTTYAGSSYYNTKKSVEVTMLLESESRNTAICLGRVRLNVNYPAKDDDTNPAYLHFTGTVLPNETASQGDFAILKATA